METNQIENIRIIRDAANILKKDYLFIKTTRIFEMSNFDNYSELEIEKIGKKLKSIRNDTKKIISTINSIDRIFSLYQKDEYVSNYVDVLSHAIIEISCHIEYLFIKYRVMFEYILDILDISIPHMLNNEEKNKYSELKNKDAKCTFLLNYISKKINNKRYNLIKNGWFQKNVSHRNKLIHEGACCFVYGDKEELLFKLIATDVYDIKEIIEYDEFYCKDNNWIKYNKYWALEISKLIIFMESIFEFLIENSDISEESKESIEFLIPEGGKGYTTTSGEPLPHFESVLENLLSSF